MEDHLENEVWQKTLEGPKANYLKLLMKYSQGFSKIKRLIELPWMIQIF